MFVFYMNVKPLLQYNHEKPAKPLNSTTKRERTEEKELEFCTARKSNRTENAHLKSSEGESRGSEERKFEKITNTSLVEGEILIES